MAANEKPVDPTAEALVARYTKAELEQLLRRAEAAPTVKVDSKTRRSGDDALLGSFVKVVAGPYRFRSGHYYEDVSHGPDGYPDRVLVRTRDSDNLRIEVDYKDLRPTVYLGGR